MSNFEQIRDAVEEAVKVYKEDLNVYRYVPRTLIPPCAIIKPRNNRTIDYMGAQSSALADWYFTIMIVIGRVDEESSQKQAGDMISPGSDLIRSLQRMKLPTGFCTVTDGAVAEMMFSQSLHTYAELQIKIKA